MTSLPALASPGWLVAPGWRPRCGGPGPCLGTLPRGLAEPPASGLQYLHARVAHSGPSPRLQLTCPASFSEALLRYLTASQTSPVTRLKQLLALPHPRTCTPFKPWSARRLPRRIRWGLGPSRCPARALGASRGLSPTLTGLRATSAIRRRRGLSLTVSHGLTATPSRASTTAASLLTSSV